MSSFLDEVEASVSKAFPPDSQYTAIKDSNDVSPKISFIFENQVFAFSLLNRYSTSDGKLIASVLNLEVSKSGRTVLNVNNERSADALQAFTNIVRGMCFRSFLRRAKFAELQRIGSFLEKISSTLPGARG